MADYTLKQGDRLPVISAVLKDSAGAAVDLTGATAKLNIVDDAGTAVSRTATISATPTDGTITYDWVADDVDVAGSFYFEYEITFPSGLKQTFPNNKHLTLEIIDDIA